VVPHDGQAPEPRQVEHGAQRDMALLAPGDDVVFRPEEEHRRSSEADVAPPLTSGHCKVDDPWRLFETCLGRRDAQRLPGVRASGEHGAGGAEQREDSERIPNTVAPPLPSAGAHQERRRYRGAGLGHPDIGATGEQNERIGLVLEAAEAILDVARCELEMGRNLDWARRTACIDEVLVDPQPDLPVADEVVYHDVSVMKAVPTRAR